MEGILILLGIFVLDVVIKKVSAKNKRTQELKNPKEPQVEAPKSASSKGNLQDLIRQFEEAQRQASQGNVEPAVPPVDKYSEYNDEEDGRFDEDDEDVDLPVVTPANPNRVTFREIAESVIQWEEVSVEYLQRAFGFSESTAQQVLTELQAHHIVGRDMGDGYCDILVHDNIELVNLFKKELRETNEQEAQQAQKNAVKAPHEAEIARQRELAALEERARVAREQAEQINDGSSQIAGPCISNAGHSSHSRSFNKAEIRRGFIWAKVLDEPRFKRHWNSRVR